MRVRIHGCKNTKLKQLLIDATQVYARELLSGQMIKHISVDVRMKSRLRDLGSCSVLFSNDYNKPREFEIELRRGRSVKSTLVTLAHEMVHLKQFAKCQLNDTHTKWKGAKIDSEAIPYHDLPWEVEANTFEYILYALYIDTVKERQQ